MEERLYSRSPCVPETLNEAAKGVQLPQHSSVLADTMSHLRELTVHEKHLEYTMPCTIPTKMVSYRQMITVT